MSAELGQGGVPKGAKTSDYYRVSGIPDRFNNPGNLILNTETVDI